MCTNGVNADGLNRLVNADFFLVNGDIKLLFQCSGNFFARDRTEKPSVFVCFAVDFYRKLAHVRCKSLCVFALNFNALFTEYDMSATFQSRYRYTYAMIIQNMCAEEGRDGYNVNASGRRCASTVFIMLVSGLILYLVYGVGARDLAERLEIKDKRRKRREKLAAAIGIKKKEIAG